MAVGHHFSGVLSAASGAARGNGRVSGQAGALKTCDAPGATPIRPETWRPLGVRALRSHPAVHPVRAAHRAVGRALSNAHETGAAPGCVRGADGNGQAAVSPGNEVARSTRRVSGAGPCAGRSARAREVPGAAAGEAGASRAAGTRCDSRDAIDSARACAADAAVFNRAPIPRTAPAASRGARSCHTADARR